VTDTTTQPGASQPDAPTKDGASAPRRSGGGLGGKVLAELQEIAGGLGISGASKMRKGELIDAIKAAEGSATSADSAPKAPNGASTAPADEPTDDTSDAPESDDKPQQKSDDTGQASADQGGGNRNRNQQGGGNRSQGNQGGNRNQQGDGNRNQQGDGNRNQGGQGNQGGNRNQQGDDNRNDDDAGGGRRRNRRGRNRGNRGPEAEPTYSEDDVLVPAAGILDILDNYAFVRTTGYLPSENDVYVSLSMVRKWGLRKGDAVVGQVRQPREGERKEKFNPMVRVDSVNGMSIEEAKKRVEFGKLTPLYPSERLRLETDASGMAGRIIDIMAPIGKGQRGLIVSPPKAGKTMIMQSIANAITANNPECHLMIVLVDERPEEVTDFQRTVKGEVISSTFDRPATDHTTVAELAIERAKRLVELGHDVVVLLDGITRLGRAYNLAAPASGRIMSGGVDSSALYPPKKFFGAARNIEDGGSLTILATALVETGSRMDEVIFEEFKGTGNWELRLRRDFADKRIYPAIDVDATSTRREELLMAKDELAVVWKLRRVLSGLEGQQGLELMLDRLKKSATNIEFLMSINKTLPQGTTASDD
jgi:transcription termination factor Rho